MNKPKVGVVMSEEMKLSDEQIDAMAMALLQQHELHPLTPSAIRQLCAQAKLANSPAHADEPVAWNLIDRALKMLWSSGYSAIEHNPDHNNPVIAWMADARAYLARPSAGIRSEVIELTPVDAIAIVAGHRRHVELSPGVGADAQKYALAVCDDIEADILRALGESS